MVILWESVVAMGNPLQISINEDVLVGRTYIYIYMWDFQLFSYEHHVEVADCPAMFGYQRVQAAIQPLGQAGAVGGWRGAGAEDDDDEY